ncbi:MAG: hypothetical protein KA538_05535 [Azonexus sp.]|nr:hypothetical protein [Azonexus sp.]
MSDPEIPDRSWPWREHRRFLLATLAVTLLYLGIQQVWMWSAAELAYRGWTVNDPALSHADEAAQLAEQSQAREATLDPQFALRVFRLGFEYGYLSQWLGGYGAPPDDVMQQLAKPVEAHTRQLNELAEQLGVAPVARLPVRTAADFSGLTLRIEDDPAGIAARIEQVGSPRLRHLFLMAAHVGTEAAGLEAAGDLLAIPATLLIGTHATLAGVPEPLWRPLSRVTRGTPEVARRDYLSAIANLDAALAGNSGRQSP